MPSVGIEQHEVSGIGVVELVQLELAGQNRQLPAQQVNEHLLARRKHGAHRRILASAS